MKNLYFAVIAALFLFVFTNQNLFSQVNVYTFSQTTSTYTEIIGGTVLGSIANDDEVFNNSTTGGSPPVTNTGFPIGFNFEYNGNTYDKFAVSNNGWIVLGTGTFTIAASSGNYTPISTTGPTGFISAISILGRDLQGQTGSSLTYLSSGISPNRILTVQWKNYRRYGLSGESYNFQINFYETTNKIEFVYGAFTVNYTSSTQPQIGIRGNTNSDYNNRTTTTNWAATTAGASNTATVRLITTIKPSTGLTFSWSPPGGPGNPTNFSAVPFSHSQINLSWTLNAGNDVMLAWNSSNTFGTPTNGTTYIVGNTIPGGGTVLYNGNGTNYSHTPLTQATTYYYKIWSKDGSVAYSTGTTANATTPCNTVSSFPYNYDFGASLDACWSITQVLGTGNWAMATTMTNPTLGPQNGTHFAYFNSYSFSAGTQSRLRTPNFDFTFLSNPRLDFWLSQSTGYNGLPDSIAIDVSTNNGSSWTTLSNGYQRINYEYPSAGWDLYSINLDAYAGLSQVSIGIRAVSLFGDNFGVDNITVYNGSPLSGSVNVGSTESITTLTGSNGLFNQINRNGLNGNLTVNITSDITEPGTYNLKPINSGNYNVTIYPGTASEKIISGNISNGLIRFYGIDGVTIDGSGTFAGTSKYLRFRNESYISPAFIFRQDAKRNTITNCYIEGNDTSTSALTAGTILFGTTGVNYPGGNDSNTISYCDIRDRSDAAVFPLYGILSYGNTSTAASYNSYNTISNCNIYNFHRTDKAALVSGIYLLSGTSDWTITGNSFYQTTTRTNTFAITYSPIYLNSATNSNHTITNNFIGGTAPGCGGSALTIGGSVTNLFYGIYQPAHSTSIASLIQNNTIQNINFTTTPTVNTTDCFAGIYVTSGYSNIFDNKVGDETGNGSITLTYDGGNFTTFTYGIAITANSIGNINNNKVGSITLGGSTTNTCTFRGIYRLGSSLAANVTINNNLVGSLTTANSIQLTSATRNDVIECIRSSVNPTVTFDGNTVANISDNSGSGVTGASTIGIYYSGSAGLPSITNNTVRDLMESENLANTYLLYGIWSMATSSNQVITGNTIYNLNHTNSSFGATTGILLSAGGTGTISHNRIYNFNIPNASTSSEIDGITLFAGSFAVTNNQITLTNGEPADYIQKGLNHLSNDIKTLKQNSTENKLLFENIQGTQNIFPENEIVTTNFPNGTKTTISYRRTDNILSSGLLNLESEIQPVSTKILNKHYTTGSNLRSTNDVSLIGIFDASIGTNNYYYNSVYIGGTGSGNSFSTCYIRAAANTVSLRNNLFYLNRTGGFDNFVLSNESATPATGWSSNYNVFIGPNASNIGEWGTGLPQDITQWRTSSGGDKQTWSTTISELNASNLFTSISSGNLNINSSNVESWIVSGKGIAITGQNIDFGGDSRATTISGGVTDIGADEFGTPGVNPPAATESAAPLGGTTTTYTLWSRTLAAIDWGLGGILYPTAITVNYFSGINHPNAIGGFYANSYSTVTPTGSLSGATYDITYYFGDNETYTIGSPTTNTILAKYSTSWDVFPPGVNPWQTQLIFNTTTSVYTAKVTALDGFSSFALTDVSSPLPVNISSFTANIDRQRNVQLTWVTDNENNNAGFDIERRTVMQSTGTGKDGDTYTAWAKISFIQGNGTTNESHTYWFTDSKLNTGKYEYRLKQKDNNGSFEYYNLTNPGQVEIGKPFAADMSQNYPNPSNPKCKIDYQLPYLAKVSIKIFDIIGREVITLVNELKQEGYYTAEFDGTNLASGMYFYRIVMEGNGEKYTTTKKMVIVK